MSIEIEPVDSIHAIKILRYLSGIYGFKMPVIHNTLDGFHADFVILNSKASVHVDNWFSSIAFEKDAVRDTIFDLLSGLSDEELDVE